MGKQLILAEKPSVAREIARVIGARQNQNGYIEGPRHIVTWALGHLVTLAEPEAYGAKYRTWSLESLPMLPDKMELVVIAKTAKQFSVIRSLMSRADVTDLVIATDSGREGELVARWIMEKAGFRKPAQRLWISSQTDKAIREGFAALKPAAQYDSLYKSAVCRAQADWFVGLNVTRALTCKHNAQLSAGRVQTPTLSMIVQREEEIKKFTPREYYRIAALVSPAGATGAAQTFTMVWQEKKAGRNEGEEAAGSARLYDKNAAEALVAKLTGKQGTVVSVRKQHKTEPPPLAYDLAELQRDANRRYSFPAKTTLSLLQNLYEFHKLVTYPRTDSRHITRDVAETLAERLKAVGRGSYAAAANGILRSGVRVTNRFVDDAKVTDHHAIIPTEQPMNMGALENDEKRVYDLIVKRFLAVLSRAHEYEETTVTADIAGERFAARGRVEGEQGWRAVYSGGVGLSGGDGDYAESGSGYGADDDEDEEDDLYVSGGAPAGGSTGGAARAATGYSAADAPAGGGSAGGTARAAKHASLPPLNKGDKLAVRSVNAIPGKTKPPARYTEATLLTAMEHPGKFIGDRELRDVIEQASGIGTPATRADIIEKLFDSFYVERGGKSGKEIFPTSKGRQLIGLVPDDLRSAELTARWERRLEQIAGRRGPAAGVGVAGTNNSSMSSAAPRSGAAAVRSVGTTTRSGNPAVHTNRAAPQSGKSRTGAAPARSVASRPISAPDVEFIREIKDYASKLVSAVIASSGAFTHDNLTRERCPDCGKYLLSVNGKKGEMLVCQDRECGYRRNVALVSNARCPECHKKLIIKGEGEARAFHCVCGHRERLSDFNARRESTVGRREVERYMAGQAQTDRAEGRLNSALSDQLKAFLDK